MSSTRETIPALTGLRAYAAIWVMLLHLQYSIGIKGVIHLGPLVDHGFWAVDIFFVLSGFILSLLYSSEFDSALRPRVYWNYLSARFARIYPLHVVALAPLAAYFLGRAALGDQLPPGFSLRNLALNVSLLHGWGFADRLSWNYPSWSIGTEWFAYLVMLPLLARGLRRVQPAAALGVAFLAWLVLYAVVHGQGALIGSQSVKWGIPRIAAEFALGYGLYRIHASYRAGPRAADALALSGAAMILALPFLPAAFELLLAPAVCALILGLTRAGPVSRAIFASRTAVFWGERSYSIYMLHAVVQIFSNIVLEHLGVAALTLPLAAGLFLTQVLAVLLVSHLAYDRLELPARRRLRLWLESLPPAPKVAAAAQAAP